jgi:hypothetical protein
MQSGMIVLGEKHEIFVAVVVLYAIRVMHFLVASQMSTEPAFNQQPMLANPSMQRMRMLRFPDHDVAVLI